MIYNQLGEVICGRASAVSRRTKCRSPVLGVSGHDAPFAPHLAEEMWSMLGHEGSLTYEPWPTYDEALCEETDGTMASTIATFCEKRQTGERDLLIRCCACRGKGRVLVTARPKGECSSRSTHRHRDQISS